MSTPVRAVRISLSVAGISFAVAGADIGLFMAHVVPPIAPYNKIGMFVFFGGYLIAFVAITLASNYGISTIVRHREECTLSDYSLIAATIVLWIVFVSGLVITSSRSVY
jgi:hypothetical protein